MAFLRRLEMSVRSMKPLGLSLGTMVDPSDMLRTNLKNHHVKGQCLHEDFADVNLQSTCGWLPYKHTID